ncbi:MAG: efflux RND transporter periplasmic adaptor subunit [Gammaproteobacteria bacterium]|nr:efflux RND transporter periplasmic adaptor subunit [Gammaproteobacteria bacterium]
MNRLNALLLIGIAVSIAACTENEPASTTGPGPEKESAAEHAVKHLDPKYVCPMHPQIIRDQPGNCPICGMELVEKKVETQGGADETSAERKILYYRHPHKPTITSDAPRKDEMGMDYIAIYDDGGGADVKISPAVVQNLGVRTATIQLDKLWRRIDTVGYVDHDETRVSHIHLRTDGWIEKLHVKSEGEHVKRGAPLFAVYSPALVNAQEEYLEALTTNSESLIRASRDRMKALGISSGQINQLQKTRKAQQRITVYAPQDGVVSALMVREGKYVKPATDVMTLADLSTVWIQAEVFEQQADWVKSSQPAEVRLSYLPGKVWEGKVDYIYPQLDAKTRTLKVRLKFDNINEALKPNMYADVTIFGGATREVLVIPREALIRTGQNTRVIINKGEGRFAPRNIVVGVESGDNVEVIAGLEQGDAVVTSGQFLIDSEASLKASLTRMSETKTTTSSADSKIGGGEDMVIEGMGTIKALKPDEHKINMEHGPIQSLGWPSMVMDFRYKHGVDISRFKPGDHVSFTLEPVDDGYVINSIDKMQHQELPQ